MNNYFPIFRGKQFELIAVREFAESDKNEFIHPVIEPVRDPTENSGLKRMIAELEEHDFSYTVIVNPGKGNLKDKSDAAETIIDHLSETTATTERMSFGLLFHAGGADDALAKIDGSPLAGAALNLVYDQPSAGPSDVGLLAGRTVAHHVVSEKGAVRRINEFSDPNYVQLLQTFKRRSKNIEYVNAPPSVFCDAHLYAGQDGYAGFADYLTIGDDYSESGALPLALVIHLTYQNPEDQLVYVRHFHSTTNKDQSDPAKKFSEAVAALVAFVDKMNLDNPALQVFRKYHDEKKFPGLGVIKKLSMLNHLYVMDVALRKQ